MPTCAYLYVSTFDCVYRHMPVCVLLCLYVCLSGCMCPCLYLFVHNCLTVCQYVCMFSCVYFVSMCQPVCLSLVVSIVIHNICIKPEIPKPLKTFPIQDGPYLLQLPGY